MIWQCGAKSMQGRRNTQEDRHVIIKDFTQFILSTTGSSNIEFNPEFLPGLFDGHMGCLASVFCAKQLPIQLAKGLEPLLTTKRLNSGCFVGPPVQGNGKGIPFGEGVVVEHPENSDTACFDSAYSSLQVLNSDGACDTLKKRKKSMEIFQLSRTEKRNLKVTNPTVSLASTPLEHADSKTSSKDVLDSSSTDLNLCEQKANHEHSLDLNVFYTAIVNAFIQTDDLFFQKHRLNKDGSTASLVLILGEHVWIAWLGDSRVVLASERSVEFEPFPDKVSVGRTIDSKKPSSSSVNVANSGIVPATKWVASALTCDHKPSRPDEKKRITEAGGHVFYSNGIPRVIRADYQAESRRRKQLNFLYCGGAPSRQAPVALAVSRSMGDREFKFGFEKPLIIAVPEIRYFRFLKNVDKAIILACDGVWDVLSDQDVVTLLNDRVEEDNMHSCEDGASIIVKTAFQRGSQDNLSLVYVCQVSNILDETEN